MDILNDRIAGVILIQTQIFVRDDARLSTWGAFCSVCNRIYENPSAVSSIAGTVKQILGIKGEELLIGIRAALKSGQSIFVQFHSINSAME